MTRCKVAATELRPGELFRAIGYEADFICLANASRIYFLEFVNNDQRYLNVMRVWTPLRGTLVEVER